MKEVLCQRLEKARKQKTPDWTLKGLNSILKKLKNNKCRDPQGLINEISKPETAGMDLQKSLLMMINKTKQTQEIPEMMKLLNVAMISNPNKPNSHAIENQRGILLINTFRSIMLKLLLRDNYGKIDSHMSDASIGGRRGRRIQDHLFIVNGVF